MAYPTTTETFPTLGTGTYQDDSGVQADVLLNQLMRAVEVLTQKVGTGSSTPINARVLRGTGTGTAAWQQIQDSDITDATISTAKLVANAVAQVTAVNGSTSGPTTTSGSAVDLAEMTRTINPTTAGSCVRMDFSGEFQNSSAGQIVGIDFVVDGANSMRRQMQAPVANQTFLMSASITITGLSAGSHTFKMQWLVGGGTGLAVATNRRLEVTEFKK